MRLFCIDLCIDLILNFFHLNILDIFRKLIEVSYFFLRLYSWLHSISFIILRHEFISTCQFGITSFWDTIQGKSNINAYFYLPRCAIIAFQKISSAKCSFVQLLQKKKFFLIILHRLCIYLTKRGFEKKGLHDKWWRGHFMIYE